MADSLRRRMMMGQGGETDPAKMYLTFEALESGTFSFARNAISYSLNGGKTWTSLAAGASTPTISAGNKICFKASHLTPVRDGGIGTFSATANFNAFGNLLSLVHGDDFTTETTLDGNYQFQVLFNMNTHLVSAENLVLPNVLVSYCYYSTFQGCSSLIAAPKLPTTNVVSSCYTRMFYGCSSLTKAPELPATTLAIGCYQEMFRNCTSLIAAPELPATTLTSGCYQQMFQNCTNLNYIKCLATSGLNQTYVTYNWVGGVASKGTFIANPNTNWSTGSDGKPSGWTRYSSANYTRLLYSIFDHTCESLNTGVALFDGSLTAYEIEMSLSDDFDNSGDILRCSGDGYNGLRIITDGEGLIDLSYRPITYDNTLACESYDDLYIQVRGDRQHVNCYMSTNSDTLNYYTDSDWQYIPISQATLQYSSRSYLSGGGTINYLRIFEVPTYIE